MPYCPKCDMEFVEGIKVCSDCGGPLVESKEVADAMKQKEKEEQLAVMAQEMDPFSGEMAKAEDADPDDNLFRQKPADEIVHAYVDKGQRYDDMSSSRIRIFPGRRGSRRGSRALPSRRLPSPDGGIPEIHL